MSLKELNLTKKQMLKLQQILAEEIKDESQQDQRDLSKERNIAKALDNVQVYVEAGKPEAFVQLDKPLLHKFEITPNGVATGSSESNMFKRADAKEIDRWKSDNVMKLDCISDEDREQLGQIQTDEITGETYMLVPMDINILIDEADITPDASTKRISEQEAYQKAKAGHTLYMTHQNKGHGLDQNPQAKQTSPAPPENQANYDYHVHTFEVPRLSFPFELKFEPDEEKLEGDKVVKPGEVQGNPDHDANLVSSMHQDVQKK
ncbi:uncharacterized protein LOC6536920 [Drosophila yakuba]|uniref:Uncharacterized protein n=1 Tax=Drosophila yakuba TaxID=7245 RepID=B4PPX4_DROYA|nr:uncharacterized protein LOC6536920 [Drosophila yakuba]EDW97201.1 uncharacterized protein Dyak_GE24464 [Drosophila yakuba]